MNQYTLEKYNSIHNKSTDKHELLQYKYDTKRHLSSYVKIYESDTYAGVVKKFKEITGKSKI